MCGNRPSLLLSTERCVRDEKRGAGNPIPPPSTDASRSKTPNPYSNVTATTSVENDAWVIRYFTSCTCQKERDWQSAISPNIGLSVFDNGEASYASLNAARAAKSGI